MSLVRRKVSAAARLTSRRKEVLRCANRPHPGRRRTPPSGRSGASSAADGAAAAAGDGGGVSSALTVWEVRAASSVFIAATRDSLWWIGSDSSVMGARIFRSGKKVGK